MGEMLQVDNHDLAERLGSAGLSPRQLARELNKTFGSGTVSATAPYHWLRGTIPREPLPVMVALVLSRLLNRHVEVTDLWPEIATDSTSAAYAIHELDGPWDFDATKRIADLWVSRGVLDRRTFLMASGELLAAAMAPYLTRMTRSHMPATRPTPGVDPLIEELRSMLPRLQAMDDEQGGGIGLEFIGSQVQAVMVAVRRLRPTDTQTRHVLSVLAEFAQLAGWKAIDARQPGLAQRYLLVALRAAREAGYRPMEAHVLADLAYQSAIAGYPSDGISLGETAHEVAARAPDRVQASVSSRLSYVYASAGQLAEAERTWRRAHDEISGPGARAEPDWMYFLTPNHLDCLAGQGMIFAGQAESDRGRSRALLVRGEELLRSGVHDTPPTGSSQRRALHEGVWMALGLAHLGRYEETGQVLDRTLPRLDAVDSARSRHILSEVAGLLRRRSRNAYVADLLPRVEAALVSASVEPTT